MKVLNKFILICMLVWGAVASAQEPRMTALETAQQGVESLLQTVQQSKAFALTDRERYLSNVGGVLENLVDFEEVAVVVMSRFAANATPQQIEKFADILQNTLTRFYGMTLASYNGEELVFLPQANPPADPRADQVIGMELRGAESSIKLQYQMFLNDAGEWKLKNLSLGGINLGRQYNTQFTAAMAQYNNDIDQVLSNWK